MDMSYILSRAMKLYIITLLSVVVHEILIFPAAKITEETDQVTKAIVSAIGIVVMYNFLKVVFPDLPPRLAGWINWLLT